MATTAATTTAPDVAATDQFTEFQDTAPEDIKVENQSWLDKRQIENEKRSDMQKAAAESLERHQVGDVDLSTQEFLHAQAAKGGLGSIGAIGAMAAQGADKAQADRAKPDMTGGGAARSVLSPAAAEAHAGLMNLLAARASGR